MSVKVIGKQSGIEYKGVQDLSEPDPRPQLLNALILGQFRRGRLDQMMRITSANIRQQLGYDPKNSDYVAVADALQNGAPYVWVQRILSEKAIPCHLMPSFVEFPLNYMTATDNESFEMIINGTSYRSAPGSPSFISSISSKVHSVLEANNLTADLSFSNGSYSEYATIQNSTNSCVTLSIFANQTVILPHTVLGVYGSNS